MRGLRAVAALLLLLTELALIFVAQLYSHAVLWLISYLGLGLVIYLGLRVKRKLWRFAICLIAAVFINRNFFLLSSGIGSSGSLIVWGLVLVGLNLSMMLLLLHLARGLRSSLTLLR